jgi:hypothetical protein
MKGRMSRRRRLESQTGGCVMTTASPSRFGLGSTVWVIIVSVLLIVLAATVMYFN